MKWLEIKDHEIILNLEGVDTIAQEFIPDDIAYRYKIVIQLSGEQCNIFTLSFISHDHMLKAWDEIRDFLTSSDERFLQIHEVEE